MRLLVKLCALTWLLTACQTAGTQLEQAAVLLEPDASVREELHKIVLQFSGFSSVTLAATDLTVSNDLVVERRHQTDHRGELIQGRNLETPQRFSLLTKDGACWLVHQNSGQRTQLKLAKCRAK